MTEPKDSGKTGIKMIIWYNTKLGRARDFTISCWPLKNAFSQTTYGTLPVSLPSCQFPACTDLKTCQSYREAPSWKQATPGFYLFCAVTYCCYSFYAHFPFNWWACVCVCGWLWFVVVRLHWLWVCVLSVQVSGCSRLKVIIEAFSKNSPSQTCACLSLEVMRSFCETAGSLPLARLLS